MTDQVQFDFSGRTVLITGGATGIGAGISKLFAANGAHVVVAQRRREIMEEFAEGAEGEVSFVEMDVRDEEARRNAVAHAVSTTGRLDVVVNNAISYIGGAFETQTLDDTLAMYETLLIGPTQLIRHAIPALRITQGSVINISSVLGRAVPEFALVNPVYSAAKAGLNHLTRNLASALGPDRIRVNAIAPGATLDEKYTDPDFRRFITDATPFARIGRADDVANAALFLSSDAASWITGQVLDVSGGWQLSS